ncbi:hypothetical protein Bca101_093550 [Brassica carinata]
MSPHNPSLPLTKVKTKLLNDGDDDLVVSAPLGCGKTTLATQLCHDEEIKEKFVYIFFCVVLSVLPLGPLYRLYSITAVTKHQKDSEAVDGLRKLIVEVKEDGPILLCWMMFEFPSFGPAYHFETFGRGVRSKSKRSMMMQIHNVTIVFAKSALNPP